MDGSRGKGVGGIDGNAHNPGYTGGATSQAGLQEPEEKERQQSTVIEPRTGLPMDLSKGSGIGGTDGDVNNPGYAGSTPAV